MVRLPGFPGKGDLQKEPRAAPDVLLLDGWKVPEAKKGPGLEGRIIKRRVEPPASQGFGDIFVGID